MPFGGDLDGRSSADALMKIVRCAISAWQELRWVRWRCLFFARCTDDPSCYDDEEGAGPAALRLCLSGKRKSANIHAGRRRRRA